MKSPGWISFTSIWKKTKTPSSRLSLSLQPIFLEFSHRNSVVFFSLSMCVLFDHFEPFLHSGWMENIIVRKHFNIFPELHTQNRAQISILQCCAERILLHYSCTFPLLADQMIANILSISTLLFSTTLYLDDEIVSGNVFLKILFEWTHYQCIYFGDRSKFVSI